MAEPTDKTLTGIQRNTIRVMTEAGGNEIITAGNGEGALFRPGLRGEYGARTANLQTLFDFFIDNVPDPDSALAANPDFDEILAQHTDVHACMTIRSKSVASMPWRVDAAEKAGDDSMAEKLAEYVKDRLNAIPNLDLMFQEMVEGGTLLGGQGHEWIWQMIEGYSAPTFSAPVHKTRFTFDRSGNMALLGVEKKGW